MIKLKEFIQRVKVFINENPQRKKLLLILFILATIPLTVIAVLTVQNLRQHAGGGNVVRISDQSGNTLNSTSDPNVFIDINLNAITNWALPGSGVGINNLVKNAYAFTASCSPPYSGYLGCFGIGADPSGSICTGSCTTDVGQAGQYCYTSTKVGQTCTTDSNLSGTCNNRGTCIVSVLPTPTPTSTPISTTTPISTPEPTPIPTTILCKDKSDCNNPPECRTAVSSICLNAGTKNAICVYGTVNTNASCTLENQTGKCNNNGTCIVGGAIPTPTPTPNILRAIYIENKDTDGSTGGSAPIKIMVNSGSDIAHIAWKLNDLLPGQNQAPRIVQVTLIGDNLAVPFATTINLVRLNGPTTSTQLEPHAYVLEYDGTFNEDDPVALTREFYKKYPDQYDFIGFHFKKLSGGAYAYAAQRPVKGAFIDEHSDQTAEYGSKGRLLGGYVNAFSFEQSFVKRDPNTIAYGLLDNFYFKIIFHELTHYWGVDLPDELKEALAGGYGPGNGSLSEGYEQSHWENYTGSWLARDVINRIKVIENPEGKYYLRYDCTSEPKHHDFDLYSMGLKSPEDIREKLIAIKGPGITGEYPTCGTKEIPSSEVERVFTIQDMIKVLGPRIPSVQNSKKDFDIAFVLVVPKGINASQEEIDALNWIADKFPVVWYKSTEGRSILNGIKPEDITPPTISNVKILTTKSSITVSWTTNEPTSPIVISTPGINGLPLSSPYPNVITNPPKFSTNHTLKLDSTDSPVISLEPSTEYAIIILSIDENYNMASFDAGKIIRTDKASSITPSALMTITQLTPTTVQFTPIFSKINYDLNNDGFVNCKDTKILIGQYGQKGTNLSADLDPDGVVNGIDYNILIRNYTPGDTTVCPQ